MNTPTIENTNNWSKEEFGGAILKNKKRTDRLVLIAKRVAEGASGQVAELFHSVAEREGAYKFLENDRIKALQVAKSSHLACARRCAKEKFVFVPVDGSTLSIDDSSDCKDLGPTGPKGMGSGLEAMSAIAIRSDGTPLGICGQIFWARKKGQKVKHTRKKRGLAEKETRYWLDAITQVEDVFEKETPSCKRWYQLDRGGDFAEMLAWTSECKSYVTIRASQNRKLDDPDANLLWKSFEHCPVLGSYSLKVLARRGRQERVATLEVSSKTVNIKLPKKIDREAQTVTLNAVRVIERDTVPKDEKAIEWLLLTNYPVNSFDDARLVIYGYSQRWKIEEFHKSWKSVCKVEEIQLRKHEGILKLATLLSAVAMRVERLKYLARTSPDLPANAEFSRYEIDALIVLRKPKGYQRGDIPPIGEVVRWAADLGGYVGKSSGGPPGTIVLGRGLYNLREAANLMEALS